MRFLLPRCVKLAAEANCERNEKQVIVRHKPFPISQKDSQLFPDVSKRSVDESYQLEHEVSLFALHGGEFISGPLQAENILHICRCSHVYLAQAVQKDITRSDRDDVERRLNGVFASSFFFQFLFSLCLRNKCKLHIKMREKHEVYYFFLFFLFFRLLLNYVSTSLSSLKTLPYIPIHSLANSCPLFKSLFKI